MVTPLWSLLIARAGAASVCPETLNGQIRALSIPLLTWYIGSGQYFGWNRHPSLCKCSREASETSHGLCRLFWGKMPSSPRASFWVHMHYISTTQEYWSKWKSGSALDHQQPCRPKGSRKNPGYEGKSALPSFYMLYSRSLVHEMDKQPVTLQADPTNPVSF